MKPQLIDVTGRSKYFVNLCQVRRIPVVEHETRGPEVRFAYTNGEEGVFNVTPGRLAVLLDQIKEWAA
jgi:hypothetical protein